MQPLAHAGQAHARTPQPDLSTDRRAPLTYWRHPPARVLDAQHDVLSVARFLAREPNSCGRALGMTGDVRQRLLHNTEHREFGVGRQPVDIGGHFEIDREAAPLDVSVDITTKGRPQAQVMSNGGCRT